MVNAAVHQRNRVAHYYNAGQSSLQIRRSLQREGIRLSERTIRDWCARLRQDEDAFLAGRKRKTTGNPLSKRHGKPALTEWEKKRAVDYAAKHPETGYRPCARELQTLGIYISASTLDQLCLKAGFHSFKPEQAIALTPAHEAKRHAFAVSHVDFPWSLVAFAYSKTFFLGGSHNPQNERYRVASPQPRHQPARKPVGGDGQARSRRQLPHQSRARSVDPARVAQGQHA